MSAPPTSERATGRRPRQPRTVVERAAAGRAARAISPRSGLGTWEPAAGRESPVTMLERQARGRVPELVPIRYGRMVASPFAFYRGAAAIMAADLAPAPRTGLEAQLCGDAHLANFGAYAAPDRRLVFSINDFDETLPGPFEWDLKRLVASFAVAGRQRGFDAEKRYSIEKDVASAYRLAMHSFAEMGSLDLWYLRLNVDEIAGRFGDEAHAAQLRAIKVAAAKAESKDSLKALAKLTRLVDGQPQFINSPPVVVRLDDLIGDDQHRRFKSTASKLIRSYASTLPADDLRVLLARYRFADIARKVVGVGSVGSLAWVVLMLGRDEHDPLLLQVKEAEASVLEPYLGKSSYGHHGQRVVEGQRLMQAASDILLGWDAAPDMDGSPRHYYVRQMWDKKGSVNVDLMNPRGMRMYAKLCGWSLARAHATSGDSIAIAAYLGTSDTFDRAMAAFAEAYAGQNELDHATLRQAIADGVVEATLNV